MPARKELHFFDNDGAFARGSEYYEAALPPPQPGILRGEITPRYMLYPEALRRIRDYRPDVRILVILRDPLARAISQYRYFLGNRRKETVTDIHRAFRASFREDYVEKSLYARQIEAVQSIFPRDRILILSYERLFSDQAAELARLADFLGIAPFGTVPDRVVNAAEVPAEFSEPPFLRKYRAPYRVIAGREHWAIPDLSPWVKSAIRTGRRRARLHRVASRILSPFLATEIPMPEIGEADRERLWREHFAEDRPRCDALLGEMTKSWFSVP